MLLCTTNPTPLKVTQADFNRSQPKSLVCYAHARVLQRCGTSSQTFNCVENATIF